MRSLFVRIFVCFWIIEVVIICSVMVEWARILGESARLGPGSDRAMALMSFAAAESYDAGGCTQLARFMTHLQQTTGFRPHLLGEDASPLCGETVPPAVLAAAAVAQPEPAVVNGDVTMGTMRTKTQLGAHYDFILETDRRYSLLDRLVAQTWTPWIALATVVSGLVTALLAWALTRPVTALRRATQELASGDLTARAPAHHTQTLAGNEVAALIHDFNKMADRLESVVGAQRRLLRDVSHELRSPLSRINIALELLRGGIDEEKVVHFERIGTELSKLNRLIGQLLQLSHMETHTGIHWTDAVSLDQLIGSVVADAEYEARTRNCTVSHDIREHLEVCGNAELLASAIENVVRNAVRYTKPCTAVVVTLSREAQTGIVNVRDFGPGVREEELSRLGTPFWRGPARSKDSTGTGLGLAITARAVRLHGGSLSIRNHADGGLEVTIRLPLSGVKAALENGADIQSVA